MDRVTLLLQERLQSTSKGLLVHALEHALCDTPDENDVLQTIVNLQIAVELFSKLYVLRRDGWRSIIDPKMHSRTESDLIAAIETGHIKTVPFWQSRDRASETLYLDADDTKLLDDFQNRRNQLMHLGIVSPSKTILNEAIWFLVRIVHQLEWKDSLPMQHQYFSNSLECFIGSTLFKKLITRSSYIAETIDRANAMYPDTVRYCLECGIEAMIEDDSDEFVCFVCGYQAPTHAIGFVDCFGCGAKSNLAYDKLNIALADQTGKCCCCRKLFVVSRCKECGNDFAAENGCPFCYE